MQVDIAGYSWLQLDTVGYNKIQLDTAGYSWIQFGTVVYVEKSYLGCCQNWLPRIAADD